MKILFIIIWKKFEICFKYKYLDVPSVHVVLFPVESKCCLWISEHVQNLFQIKKTGIDEEWDAVSCWQSLKHHNEKSVPELEEPDTSCHLTMIVPLKKYQWTGLKERRLTKKRVDENPPLTFSFSKIFKQSWSWSRRTEDPSLLMKKWNIFPQRHDEDNSLIKTA